MKYLLTTTEVYRASSEEEATNLIETAKNESGYVLSKYGTQYKERKQKGEVIDAWYRVTLVKTFNEEKEPITSIEIKYGDGSAF